MYRSDRDAIIQKTSDSTANDDDLLRLFDYPVIIQRVNGYEGEQMLVI